jgi:hypothetical protein
MWFCVAVAGMSIRSDLRGITGIVRAWGLVGTCYDRLLDMFHSPAVQVDDLATVWTQTVLGVLKPFLTMFNGRIVLVCDGIKVAKSGRKMPAVKKLHQQSDSNTKPEYIFGHSCQAVAVLAGTAQTVFALPLIARIHEGPKFTNRDRRTQLDHLVAMVAGLKVGRPFYLLGDAYYATRTVIGGMLKSGQHLITVVRSNAVAHEPAVRPEKPGRGAPAKSGKKVYLRDLFAYPDAVGIASPLAGEKGMVIRCVVRRLYWKSAGTIVLFVAANHPTRGKKIFLSTDTTLKLEDILRAYGLRFKIEVGFKQAVHTIGVFAYHFWMRAMTPRPKKSGDQHLHRKPETYRDMVKRKMHAYHVHMQAGVIAQGIAQILAITSPKLVWKHFGSWIRTIREGILPSEQVTVLALRNTLPEFLADSSEEPILAEFVKEKIDLNRAEGLRMIYSNSA